MLSNASIQSPLLINVNLTFKGAKKNAFKFVVGVYDIKCFNLKEMTFNISASKYKPDTIEVLSLEAKILCKLDNIENYRRKRKQ